MVPKKSTKWLTKLKVVHNLNVSFTKFFRVTTSKIVFTSIRHSDCTPLENHEKSLIAEDFAFSKFASSLNDNISANQSLSI